MISGAISSSLNSLAAQQQAQAEMQRAYCAQQQNMAQSLMGAQAMNASSALNALGAPGSLLGGALGPVLPFSGGPCGTAYVPSYAYRPPRESKGMWRNLWRVMVIGTVRASRIPELPLEPMSISQARWFLRGCGAIALATLLALTLP